MILVYCYVCGDILHRGHIEYLKNCKALGDKLVVGVLTDEAIMEKKPKPIMSFDERVDLIRNIKSVDVVVAQYTYSPVDNIESLKPDILIESTDHKEQPANDFVKRYSGRIIILPYYPDHSSTKVKDLMG